MSGKRIDETKPLGLIDYFYNEILATIIQLNDLFKCAVFFSVNDKILKPLELPHKIIMT